jgi:hypothetical protein
LRCKVWRRSKERPNALAHNSGISRRSSRACCDSII